VTLLPRIGEFLRGLSRWGARLAALLSGGISALGFAPFDFFPLLLLGFAALLLLLDGAAARPHPIRHAAWLGWAFGFGQFLVGLHWVGFAFLVDPSAHEWQIPFVAFLFPGGLALFIAGACAVAMRFWMPGPSRVFVFTVSYALAEWLRGHVLTGFPWNIAGYGWGASLAVMQSAAVIGVYGLTLLTILLAASLAELFEGMQRWRLPAATVGLFVALFVAGEIRLLSAHDQTVPGVRLRIVQPDIAQADKYRPELVERNWERLIRLSMTPAAEAPTHIIWPEAAPPFVLTRSPEALDEIALLTGRNKVLLTGALRVLRSGDRLNYYNGFYVFGHGGQLLAVYDKFHLVPFGEYLPYEETLKRFGLTKVVGIDGSFSTGDGPHTLDIPGAPPVGPLICYEILFPEEIVASRRPDWIVNVSDDSWFGPWAGPRQHLLVAQARAIEQGLPIVRATNSGISAVIDPYGRIREKLELDQMGTIDAALPSRIEPTWYARSGKYSFWFLLLLCCAATYLLRRTAAPASQE
jgi:apolipoprotein N-acyltransferase